MDCLRFGIAGCLLQGRWQNRRNSIPAAIILRGPFAAAQETQGSAGEHAQIRQVEDVAVQGPRGTGKLKVIADPALRSALVEIAQPSA